VSFSGPFSPDTVFWRAANGEFDAILCMYHDQGLIPLKLLGFQAQNHLVYNAIPIILNQFWVGLKVSDEAMCCKFVIRLELTILKGCWRPYGVGPSQTLVQNTLLKVSRKHTLGEEALEL
jgi:hypothetical protein